ncbi:hypothetical protein AO440_000407 [Nakaseomyces glabratus]|uniref:Uncharacterized protein n=1 Tax=Candida glabrata TaxID=5478 RepID=A0A0W0DFK4_CANGB|nr:hypothetical protein AO440_000407 [Nakaseomyces glabratus]
MQNEACHQQGPSSRRNVRKGLVPGGRTVNRSAFLLSTPHLRREKENESEGNAAGGGRGDPLSQYVNHSASGGGAQKWPEGAAYGTGSDAVRLQEGIAHAAHAAHAEPYAHDAPFLASRILTAHTPPTVHTAPTVASTPSHQPLSKHLCQDMSCRCQDVPRRAKTSLGRAKDKFTFLFRSQHTRTKTCHQHNSPHWCDATQLLCPVISTTIIVSSLVNTHRDNHPCYVREFCKK